AQSCRAVELVEIGAVLIGDEHRRSVVRNADALGIEARIVGIGGELRWIEVVRAPGEEVCMSRRVERGNAASYTEAGARSVNQRRPAREQCRVAECRRQDER